MKTSLQKLQAGIFLHNHREEIGTAPPGIFVNNTNSIYYQNNKVLKKLFDKKGELFRTFVLPPIPDLHSRIFDILPRLKPWDS